MSTGNEEMFQDSVEDDNKMQKMNRQPEHTVDVDTDVDRTWQFVVDDNDDNDDDDITSDTSPLILLSNDSQESWIKPDSDFKREYKGAIEKSSCKDLNLNSVDLNTYSDMEQNLEDQVISGCDDIVKGNVEPLYTEIVNKRDMFVMNGSLTNGCNQVKTAEVLDQTNEELMEQNDDTEITDDKPLLSMDYEVEEEHICRSEVQLEDFVDCMQSRRISIGDYHYIRMNAFPLVKHDAVSSLDSSSSEEIGEEVFEDIRPDKCDALGKTDDIGKKPDKNKPDKVRAVRFLRSFRSRDSFDNLDMIDAGGNDLDKVENPTTLANDIPDVKVIMKDKRESVVQKHVNVLGELKSQVKAVKKEHIEKEQNARRCFGHVLKQLKAYSLVSVCILVFLIISK